MIATYLDSRRPSCRRVSSLKYASQDGLHPTFLVMDTNPSGRSFSPLFVPSCYFCFSFWLSLLILPFVILSLNRYSRCLRSCVLPLFCPDRRGGATPFFVISHLTSPLPADQLVHSLDPPPVISLSSNLVNPSFVLELRFSSPSPEAPTRARGCPLPILRKKFSIYIFFFSFYFFALSIPSCLRARGPIEKSNPPGSTQKFPFSSERPGSFPVPLEPRVLSFIYSCQQPSCPIICTLLNLTSHLWLFSEKCVTRPSSTTSLIFV